MSFERLSRRILRRPTEKYILQTRILYDKDRKNKVLKDEIGNIVTKDDIGNIKEEWMDIEELSGVIQHRQYEKEKNRVLSISESGIESTIRYFGYFDPTFNLNTNKLDDYRVKFIRDYETLYLKIIEYDANNYLRGKHHHIVLGMDEDRKYYGRQRDRKNAKIDVNIPSFAQLGEDINIDISIPEDAEGYIIVNKTKIPIQSNNISTVISDLPLGRNIIKIIYSGDKNYNKSIIEKEINIKENLIISDNEIFIDAPAIESKFGEENFFIVSLTDKKGNPVIRKNIKIVLQEIVDDKITYQVVMKPITDYYGQFNYSTKSLSPGYYCMTITVDDENEISSIKIIE